MNFETNNPNCAGCCESAAALNASPFPIFPYWGRVSCPECSKALGAAMACEACASPFTRPGQICPECTENNRPGGPGGGRE